LIAEGQHYYNWIACIALILERYFEMSDLTPFSKDVYKDYYPFITTHTKLQLQVKFRAETIKTIFMNHTINTGRHFTNNAALALTNKIEIMINSD